MSETRGWISRNLKWLIVAAIPVMIVLWWEFRPEKLFVNEKVNEAAPFATNEAQPILTGKLQGQAHPTSGRATIYDSGGGKRSLRLTNFETSNGPDVHVVLVRADDESLKQDIVKGNLDNVELGSLKGNQGDQNYDLPTGADLQKYSAVAIYCERFHAVFGVARLEKF